MRPCSSRVRRGGEDGADAGHDGTVDLGRQVQRHADRVVVRQERVREHVDGVPVAGEEQRDGPGVERVPLEQDALVLQAE